MTAEQSLTPPEGDTVSEALLEARLARLNWQKYNDEPGDEIVYQAEKMASAIDKLEAALQSRPTVSEGVVEAVARALYECDGGSAQEFGEETTTTRPAYFALARAAIAALQSRVSPDDALTAAKAERDKWKQRAFALECQHGDLQGVFVQRKAEPDAEGGE